MVEVVVGAMDVDEVGVDVVVEVVVVGGVVEVVVDEVVVGAVVDEVVVDEVVVGVVVEVVVDEVVVGAVVDVDVDEDVVGPVVDVDVDEVDTPKEIGASPTPETLLRVATTRHVSPVVQSTFVVSEETKVLVTVTATGPKLPDGFVVNIPMSLHSSKPRAGLNLHS